MVAPTVPDEAPFVEVKGTCMISAVTISPLCFTTFVEHATHGLPSSDIESSSGHDISRTADNTIADAFDQPYAPLSQSMTILYKAASTRKKICNMSGRSDELLLGCMR